MRFIKLLFLLQFSLGPLLGQVSTDSIEFDPKNQTHLILAFEEAFQLARDIKNDLRTKIDLTEIEDGYRDALGRLENYQKIGEEDLENSTLSRMNDLVTIFERQVETLSKWQESITQMVRDLSNYRIELAKHLERLQLDQRDLTYIEREYYKISWAPLVNELDSLNGVVEEELLGFLKLESEIVGHYNTLNNKVIDLKSYEREHWDNLMQKEEMNWRIFGGQRTNLASAGSKLSDTAWRITDFYKENADRVAYLVLIFVLTIYLIKRIEKEDQKEPNEDARHPELYKHPYAFGILLGGLLFPAIFPPTTSLMYDFALLISYLPFLFILYYKLAPKYFRTYVLFFIFLLLLKTFNIISSGAGFFAIVLVLSSLDFYFATKPNSLRKFFPVRWRWLTIFNWLLRAVLLAGVLCIVLQRFRLGSILIVGAGETIATGLILLYMAHWSDELIQFLSKKSISRNLAANKDQLKAFWNKWGNRIYIALLVIFLVAALKNFGLFTATKDKLVFFFSSPRTLGELEFTYGGITLFLLVIYISSKLSSTIKFLTEDKAYYKSEKETANLAVIIRFMLVTMGFLLALLVSGIPIDRITIILGALSVGIGFGLQNIVNNLISGIILIFERPIQTGDLVELQQYTGFVKDIGIRSSVIRTYDGAEVIVPNGNLVSQEVINWTLSNRQRRIEVRVGVAYGSNVAKVKEVLNAVLVTHEKVLHYPPPQVLLDVFGDSSIDFRLLVWTTDIDNWLRIRSEIAEMVYEALDQAGIVIPFPQRDLHLISWKADHQPNTTTKRQDSKNRGGQIDKLEKDQKDQPPKSQDTEDVK